VIPQEALAKSRVELIVLGEPQRGTRFAPERDDSPCLWIGLQGGKKRQGEKSGCGIHRFLRGGKVSREIMLNPVIRFQPYAEQN
jgi:hypothetical protein